MLARCALRCRHDAYRTLASSTTVQPALTHVDDHGQATMVDVGEKSITRRTASASAQVSIANDTARLFRRNNELTRLPTRLAAWQVVLNKTAFELVSSNRLDKGDVLTVAKLAGIMGAKHTATLIPLCHNIAIDTVSVELQLDPEEKSVVISAVR